MIVMMMVVVVVVIINFPCQKDKANFNTGNNNLIIMTNTSKV